MLAGLSAVDDSFHVDDVLGPAGLQHRDLLLEDDCLLGTYPRLDVDKVDRIFSMTAKQAQDLSARIGAHGNAEGSVVKASLESGRNIEINWLHADALEAIAQLHDPIGVFFYRGDSSEGSNLWWLFHMEQGEREWDANDWEEEGHEGDFEVAPCAPWPLSRVAQPLGGRSFDSD